MPDTNEEELKRKVTALVRRRFNDDFRAMFEHYSRHRQGDERIDRDELSELLADAEIGNRLTRGSWVIGVLRQLDTDHDSAVSWAEFERVVNAYSARSVP